MKAHIRLNIGPYEYYTGNVTSLLENSRFITGGVFLVGDVT